jgi:fido (protein-threonine AMPylation protein)
MEGSSSIVDHLAASPYGVFKKNIYMCDRVIINRMRQPIYRLEKKLTSTGKAEYYLAKDFRVRNHKSKVVKYIGTDEPDPRKIEQLSIEHSSEIELKVIEKKAEFSALDYKDDLFPPKIRAEVITHVEGVKYLVLGFKDIMTTREVDVYEEGLEIDYIHGTTAIEGNTFDARETRNLILEGTLPRDKSLREINEVQNFKNVARYRNKYEGKVTLEFFKRLHALIMNNIDTEGAGTFRETDLVGITGRDFLLTPALMIEEELLAAIDHYYGRIEAGYHPFFEAVIFHHKFERIHPFTDGNGRVGREVLNYMLMAEKYPRLQFVKERPAYMEALADGDNGDLGGMVLKMVGIVIEQRQHVARRNIENLSQLAKKDGQTRLLDFKS